MKIKASEYRERFIPDKKDGTTTCTRITAQEYRVRFVKSDEAGSGNRKVLNATKIEHNGITFDSKVEKYMFDLLRLAKIPFEFQKKYFLQENFRYNGKAIRPITYTPDFYLPLQNCIIDTKGVKTQQGTLRLKMLMRRLKESNEAPEIFIPQNPAECDKLIGELIRNEEKKRKI